MNRVTVRYFASARAATGVSEEVVELRDGGTVAELLEQIQSMHGDRLHQVLRRSSFLLDEVAVHNPQSLARPGSTLDVLPPFAGG